MRKAKHTFLQQRKANAFWIVVRLDVYSSHKTTNLQGFPPVAQELSRRGWLWPTEQQAAEAAAYLLNKNPGHLYGVFKLHALAEAVTKPPVTYVRV